MLPVALPGVVVIRSQALSKPPPPFVPQHIYRVARRLHDLPTAQSNTLAPSAHTTLFCGMCDGGGVRQLRVSPAWLHTCLGVALAL